jgi:hypothetical protein
MEVDLDPSKATKTAHKPNACAPLILSSNQWLRLLLGDTHNPNPSLHSQQRQRDRELLLLLLRERERRESRTYTHLNVRREKNLSRFGGCKPVIFKLVIGGLNLVGLTPNLVILFLA